MNDGVINAFAQDKYGYVWLGSIGGLNRFNSKKVKRYTHIIGNSSSVPPNVVYTMDCGADGRLWIGYESGMWEYNYITDNFSSIESTKGMFIHSLVAMDNSKVFFLNSGKLFCYDAIKHATTLAYDTASATGKIFRDYGTGVLWREGKLIYACAREGYIIYNPATRTAEYVHIAELKDFWASGITVDTEGQVWLRNVRKQGILLRYNPASKEVTRLDSLLIMNDKSLLALPTDMVADKRGNMWIITNLKGLIGYNLATGKVSFHRHDPQVSSSLSTDLLRTMFISSDETIWVSSFEGVDYFHPDKNLFEVIYPFEVNPNNMLARGVAEDHENNLWFTTGDGITHYNTKTKQYKVWKNSPDQKPVIWYNSVRGVIEDVNHDVWIATGKGVNCYHPSTGKIDFLTAADGIPEAFYFSATADSSGRIWFGTRDYSGYYYYVPSEKKFYDIADHPQLKVFINKGGRFVLEDSKQRLWFGFNSNGLGMFDQRTLKTQYWQQNDKPNSIVGDIIVDIKEDKTGIIWVSTLSGISGINPETGNVQSFNDKNGLPSNMSSGIIIDALNRLWIGTPAGLMMLDAGRKHFTYFGEEQGLPTIEFPEHPANYLKNGEAIIPTTKGYIRFNPLNYKETIQPLACYIASISTYNNSGESYHSLYTTNELQFEPEENFFTIELEALNYADPGRTWYAYKLDGLEKEWHYTHDPKAVYTSLPGGEYTFIYKASADRNNWDTPEKSISINIAIPFYKAIWFRVLLVAVTSLILFLIYRFRAKQIREITELNNRAQLLEKEKSVVMYENLKQQLNPHFLFNSLTSLSSLITTDAPTARKFVEQMSKIYRYILKSSTNEMVALKSEVDFAMTYVKLQQTRFRDGLIVNFKIHDDLMYRMIVPVTIQNLIENAIKHNIIDAESPLLISIETINDYLVVSNNLQKKTQVETSNKMGLVQMKTLYSFLTDKPLMIEEDVNSFTIRIPLI